MDLAYNVNLLHVLHLCWRKVRFVSQSSNDIGSTHIKDMVSLDASSFFLDLKNIFKSDALKWL